MDGLGIGVDVDIYRVQTRGRRGDEATRIRRDEEAEADRQKQPQEKKKLEKAEEAHGQGHTHHTHGRAYRDRRRCWIVAVGWGLAGWRRSCIDSVCSPSAVGGKEGLARNHTHAHTRRPPSQYNAVTPCVAQELSSAASFCLYVVTSQPARPWNDWNPSLVGSLLAEMRMTPLDGMLFSSPVSCGEASPRA